MNEQEFLIFFMEKIGFPEEAQEFFQGLHRQILKETEYNRRMDYIIKVFMDNQSEKAFEQADLLAKDMNIHSYTMSMMLLLLSCKPLSELYYERNISEDIFWDTLADLTYKLNECRHIYGIWGTFVRTWFPPFYQTARFALGRMQYEYSSFFLDEYSLNGVTLKKGDKVINMHIPSSGSFSEKARMDSYQRAYRFFEKDFPEKTVPIVCSSWLLYPGYRDILPAHSNIRNFMDDFSYIKGYNRKEFTDSWRIFGKDAGKPPVDLPRDTSLQKAFAEYLEKGGTPGVGYGILFSTCSK